MLPGLMRALVAAILALTLLVAATAPHVHPHAAAGGDECAVCTLRHTAPQGSATPDVAPVVHVAAVLAGTPALPPVFGAPLGAVPGQSPPAGA
jgi:hypothetical protein